MASNTAWKIEYKEKENTRRKLVYYRYTKYFKYIPLFFLAKVVKSTSFVGKLDVNVTL